MDQCAGESGAAVCRHLLHQPGHARCIYLLTASGLCPPSQARFPNTGNATLPTLSYVLLGLLALNVVSSMPFSFLPPPTPSHHLPSAPHPLPPSFLASLLFLPCRPGSVTVHLAVILPRPTLVLRIGYAKGFTQGVGHLVHTGVSAARVASHCRLAFVLSWQLSICTRHNVPTRKPLFFNFVNIKACCTGPFLAQG